jgi:DNA-binding NarL/FixJ family response regulator
MSRTRIVVVDDFEPWRRFVSFVIQSEPNWQIVGEASDGVEAVSKAQELRPDLILLDVGLPKLSGIEAARQIRQTFPEAKIIFLSQETSADIVEEAIRSGASGFVFKTKSNNDLLRAIGSALEGKQFISTGVPVAADRGARVAD